MVGRQCAARRTNRTGRIDARKPPVLVAFCSNFILHIPSIPRWHHHSLCMDLSSRRAHTIYLHAIRVIRLYHTFTDAWRARASKNSLFFRRPSSATQICLYKHLRLPPIDCNRAHLQSLSVWMCARERAGSFHEWLTFRLSDGVYNHNGKKIVQRWRPHTGEQKRGDCAKLKRKSCA